MGAKSDRTPTMGNANNKKNETVVKGRRMKKKIVELDVSWKGGNSRSADDGVMVVGEWSAGPLWYLRTRRKIFQERQEEMMGVQSRCA